MGKLFRIIILSIVLFTLLASFISRHELVIRTSNSTTSDSSLIGRNKEVESSGLTSGNIIWYRRDGSGRSAT